MATQTIFHNDNGLDYKVLDLLNFNATDAEYYKNSWQKHRLALLQGGGTYVVASYLGETSWGYGKYFDDLMDAKACYIKERDNYYSE